MTKTFCLANQRDTDLQKLLGCTNASVRKPCSAIEEAAIITIALSHELVRWTKIDFPSAKWRPYDELFTNKVPKFILKRIKEYDTSSNNGLLQ
eukprot:497613-Rhodomonas_salina.1